MCPMIGGMPPQTVKTKQYDADAGLRRNYPTETRDPRAYGLPERFVVKVQVDPETGCWMWKAARGLRGHGRFGNNGGRKATPRVVPAHMFAFKQIIGRYPDRLELDHLCRRPTCVNPWHLEPVTHAENVRRGLQGNTDGRCRRGIHLLSEVGTFSDGNRCRECRRQSDRDRFPGVSPALRTHCPQGHPYAGDNLYVKPNGNRECRECHRTRERSNYRRKRGLPDG